MARVEYLGEACPHCGLVVTALPPVEEHRLCENCRRLTPIAELLVATTANSYRNPENYRYWVRLKNG